MLVAPEPSSSRISQKSSGGLKRFSSNMFSYGFLKFWSCLQRLYNDLFDRNIDDKRGRVWPAMFAIYFEVYSTRLGICGVRNYGLMPGGALHSWLSLQSIQQIATLERMVGGPGSEAILCLRGFDKGSATSSYLTLNEIKSCDAIFNGFSLFAAYLHIHVDSSITHSPLLR